MLIRHLPQVIFVTLLHMVNFIKTVIFSYIFEITISDSPSTSSGHRAVSALVERLVQCLFPYIKKKTENSICSELLHQVMSDADLREEILQYLDVEDLLHMLKFVLLIFTS